MIKHVYDLAAWKSSNRGVVVFAQLPEGFPAPVFHSLASAYLEKIWTSAPETPVYTGLAPAMAGVLADLAVNHQLPRGTIRGLTFDRFPISKAIAECPNAEAFSIIVLPSLSDKSGRMAQESLTCMRNLLMRCGQAAIAFGGKTWDHNHEGDMPGILQECAMWHAYRGEQTLYLGANCGGMAADILTGNAESGPLPYSRILEMAKAAARGDAPSDEKWMRLPIVVRDYLLKSLMASVSVFGETWLPSVLSGQAAAV